MQTQGISLNASAMRTMSSGKAGKGDKTVFDSIMSQNASSASGKKQNLSAGKSQEPRKSGEITAGGDDFTKQKLSLTSQPQEKAVGMETVDLEEVGEEVVSLLQETFGMSEEDIVDILEMLGLTPMDLLLLVSPEFQNVVPLNVENIKAFIMEVHGVEDANLFLFSDAMSSELNDIMSGLQDILEQVTGMDIAKLNEGDEVLTGFAEKFSEFIGKAEGTVKETVVENSGKQDIPEMMTSAARDEIPVVVETSGEQDLSDTYGESQQPASQSVRQEVHESPLNAFVERLSQSFEEVAQEEVAAPRELMTNIVDQVVNHIRIRVLPQTTSMELQLNPESLGRVNLNVTSNNGLATATLTVQNEVAKEALESQLTVLRENLESHGLKVDSVEVNVSEFGFKNPEDSDHGQYKQKKSQGKKFRYDVAEESEIEEVTTETAGDRLVGDSMVDYTA